MGPHGRPHPRVLSPRPSTPRGRGAEFPAPPRTRGRFPGRCPSRAPRAASADPFQSPGRARKPLTSRAFRPPPRARPQPRGRVAPALRNVPHEAAKRTARHEPAAPGPHNRIRCVPCATRALPAVGLIPLSRAKESYGLVHGRGGEPFWGPDRGPTHQRQFHRRGGAHDIASGTHHSLPPRTRAVAARLLIAPDSSTPQRARMRRHRRSHAVARRRVAPRSTRRRPSARDVRCRSLTHRDIPASVPRLS